VVDRREQRRRDAAARQQLASLRTELKAVEKDLERLSAERRELEQRMLDAAASSSNDPAIRTVPQRLGVLGKQIDALEERWLELGALLEAAASPT
jgi:ATP-binding cassette subfamily F protein 3